MPCGRRAVGRVRDRLALGVLQRLDRRGRRHVPVEIGGAGGFRADDPHRCALRERGQHAHDAGGHADVDAAGDHRLLRLAGALRPQNLEHESVLLEDARPLSDLGNRRVPVAPLPGGELEGVLRLRQRAGQADHERQQGTPENARSAHCRSSWARADRCVAGHRLMAMGSVGSVRPARSVARASASVNAKPRYHRRRPGETTPTARSGGGDVECQMRNRPRSRCASSARNGSRRMCGCSSCAIRRAARCPRSPRGATSRCARPRVPFASIRCATIRPSAIVI